MSFWSKARGTIETIFQLGLGGPQLKQNTISSVVGIDARNSADSAFVVARAGDPASTTGTANADNDLTTKHYSDRRFSRTFLLMGA